MTMYPDFEPQNVSICPDWGSLTVANGNDAFRELQSGHMDIFGAPQSGLVLGESSKWSIKKLEGS